MAKYKEYRQNQIMLMPPSLEEKVPMDHLARYINEVVEGLDLREIEEGYSEVGCRAYHPRMLLKLLIYGYSIGIRSSRRIRKEAREDLIFMWLAGMQEPDFRTISDFRKARVGDIQLLFQQVLDTCIELGMVKCGNITLDGTKVAANSGKNKLTFRKSLEKRKNNYQQKIEEILAEAEKLDIEEDRLYGDTDGYSLPKSYTKDEIRKALKKINRDRRKLEKQSNKLNGKMEVVNSKIDRLGDERNSFGNTDQDATLMLMKEGYLGVGYNIQMATENQVVVGYGVYQKPNDVHLLEPMIKEIETNLGMRPGSIIADKGYCSQSNYEYVEGKGIQAVIPPNTFDDDRVAIRKGTYTPSKNITYDRMKLRMIDFLETEEGKKLLERRKHDIEPTFGDIKHNMGFRKLLLRGIPKVKIEIGLVSIAHNIKKIKRWMEMRDIGLLFGAENHVIQAIQ